MNYYGYPPGYHPAITKEPVEIPERIKRKAREVGATHLSADGKTAYRLLFEHWLQAYWNGVEFGSWFEAPDGVASGAVKL